MQPYLSVDGVFVTQKIIEKSRFITTSRHVEGEEAATAFIDEVRKKYGDATHNCHAFICDAQGNFLRFSDDGEPKGTAGMPMLEVLKAKNLRQTAVVVTRYFGGIKLGAGGLVRAYSGCVAENLSGAKIVEYTSCVNRLVAVEYPLVDTLLRFLKERSYVSSNPEYGSKVSVEVCVRAAEAEEFFSDLINRLGGRADIVPLGDSIRPFPLSPTDSEK